MTSSQQPPTPASKKQMREEQRAAQLETFKKRQAAEKRGRIISRVLIAGAVVAVLAVVATVIVVANQPEPTAPAVADVADDLAVETWTGLEQTHVTGTVDYEMDPPAGGPHNQVWLNCGVYSEPQVNENAVHDLEHGAIWITYDPALPESEIATLRERTPATYALLSPYPGLDAPIVVSAWGAQLKFNEADDPRLDDFITTYWQSPNAPEPGAPCTGGITGPGLVS